MTVYPFDIDDDASIIRVDDNITEIGGDAINQLREAVFAIEEELGIRPSGSAGSVATRFDTAHNADGSIKTSALVSVGLATLPISNTHIATNAGIAENKLDLDHSTSDLYTLGISNQALINSLTSFAKTTSSDLNTHVAGGQLLSDSSPARHVASHIDLNSVPSDSRDVSFTWGGLLNKDGVQRSASTVAEALLQINEDFVDHQNATQDAHHASSININVDDFEEIPQTVNDVQKLADHLDNFEVVTVGEHRATQHANAIPQIGRINSCTLPDGYGQNVVPNTPVRTYLVTSPNITPVDDISTGDDIVSFVPDNTDFIFDSKFSQVKPGDIIRINYGNGLEASYHIDALRYVPGSTWVVRLNGINLEDVTDGYASARIDRPLWDRNTAGILAVSAANATPVGFFNNQLSSVIVSQPRGAVAIGNGFDPGQLDNSHYNLYLELYPSGNPSDHVISLPAIDVTGNQGTTPGRYTLSSIIQSTNNALREVGYNYRMVAFDHDGNFAIMMADAINCASFSITSGSLVSGSLAVGSFTNNVIGDAAGDGFDALGLGATHANIASPAYSTASTFTDTTAAQTPTKVIVPFKNRNYIVDGKKRDKFAPTWMASTDDNGDYYWDGYIAARNVVGSFTVETTYTVNLDLRAAGLAPGKTLVVQPTVDFSSSSYLDVDYGRFIIKSVTFPSVCPGETEQTSITVINGIHGDGSGVAFSSGPELPVKIYFSEDSVIFNDEHVISTSPTALNYHRLHEVFISKQLKTFSHERARMPEQNETGSLLATTNWHIENVSPKLRGYVDSTLDQDRYLRLFILSYDSTTGEYDGYIGQRSGSSITKVGPVTTGRKNVVTRFYDETYVDFIDLKFLDTSSSLGSANSVLSDGIAGGGGTPRYVDIELFPSLQLSDDMMLLATVEVNWKPSTGEAIIQHVVNRRELGSIDEEDFTQSATNFITAGDRHLHENGVIRGFGFDFVNPSDNRELFFKGGVGLVNGNILTTNAISVTIPQITEDPATTGSVDWAVCLNEEGFLEPIIVTSSKKQFFARDFESPNSTYYVPSVTFQELVENRKNLLPIAVVTATIASVTITDSDVLDVRRFVDDGKKRELVYSPKDFTGTFHSATAVKNWVNQYASANPVIVKVRGEFDITSSQDLTGLTSPLILEGDGAVFNVTSNRGFLIESNVTFRGIEFNYNDSGSLSFTSDDIINIDNGCIYAAVGTDVSDITIEDCVFNSDESRQRAPFIALERDKGDIVQNLFVRRNKFNDSNVLAENMAAVAIVTNNSVAGTEPAVLYHCRIEDNICNRLQGIWVTQFADDTTFDISEPGIVAFDTHISRNNCGIIGFVTSSVDTSSILFTQPDRHSGITIDHNVANVIGNFVNLPAGGAFEGTVFALADEFVNMAAGSFHILHNDTNFIGINNTDVDISSGYFSRNTIIGNTVSATNYTVLDKFTNTSATTSFSGDVRGINVGHGQSDIGHVVISDNILSPGRFDSTNYQFNIGIITSVSSNVSNNIIRGLATNGYGIYASNSNAGFRQINITGNQIYRDSNSITRYIELGTDESKIGGTVVDNYLDKNTIDNSDTDTITPASIRAVTWVVERNKNQTEEININSLEQTFLSNIVQSDSFVSTISQKSTLTSASSTDIFNGAYSALDAPGNVTFGSRIALFNYLPKNVTIQEIEVTIAVSSAPATTGDLSLKLSRFGATTAEDTGDVTSPNPTTDTLLISNDGVNFNTNDFVNTAYNNLQVEVSALINNSTSLNVDISSIKITYRW